MSNYKMVIQYDGSAYNGWQRQENAKHTIQEVLEETLTGLLGTGIELIGSGRTDAGVHAYGQVANFHTGTNIDTHKVRNKGNEMLPPDIKIVSLDAVEESFHSRYSAKSKYYLYRISENRVSVFDRKYVYDIGETLDKKKIRQAVALLQGEHDFYGFSSLKDEKKQSIRTLHEIQVLEKEIEVQFMFHGDGFLYNMVRILTGTLIEIGLGQRELTSIPQVFDTRDRILAGKTAPAKGLFLYEVTY